MNANNFRIINENLGAAGGAALPQDADTAREQAAERLAREMEEAARASGHLAERLERLIESEKTRQRTGWNRGGRSRAGRMRFATG